MAPVRVFGQGEDEWVLGTDHGFELHGGGVLALLLDHWRPDGRPATLDDAFPFARHGTSLPLAAIHAAQRRQVFLPVPGRPPTEIDGALPDPPVLARMRLPRPGGGAVEVDAYAFLRVLAVHARDLDAVWVNRVGQHLSAALLLEHARRHYLSTRDTRAEPQDHSELHLLEVLLPAGRRRGTAPEPLQQRFLRVELARRDFAPDDAGLMLGHYAQSLGRLLADERVRWSAEERARVRRWLRWLADAHFRDPAAEDPRALAHLLHGLRLVQAHRARLE